MPAVSLCIPCTQHTSETAAAACPLGTPSPVPSTDPFPGPPAAVPSSAHVCAASAGRTTGSGHQASARLGAAAAAAPAALSAAAAVAAVAAVDHGSPLAFLHRCPAVAATAAAANLHLLLAAGGHEEEAAVALARSAAAGAIAAAAAGVAATAAAVGVAVAVWAAATAAGTAAEAAVGVAESQGQCCPPQAVSQQLGLLAACCCLLPPLPLLLLLLQPHLGPTVSTLLAPWLTWPAGNLHVQQAAKQHKYNSGVRCSSTITKAQLSIQQL